MTRQILLPASVLREMRETFKVGRNVLRRALNYWKIQCKMPPKTKKILPPENIQ